MVTVAFLFALAPVFHAVCVSAVGSSSESHTSHVMADGTVMNMTVQVSPDVMNMGASPSFDVEPISPHSANETAHVMGTIMITAGLTLLTFFGLRLCKQMLARGFAAAITKPSLVKLSEVGIARARPPSQVNLNTLCISRT